MFMELQKSSIWRTTSLRSSDLYLQSLHSQVYIYFLFFYLLFITYLLWYILFLLYTYIGILVL